MPDYDSGNFSPAAPMALVELKKEGNVLASGVPMLIDTGADVTLIPSGVIESGLLDQSANYELEGFDGTRSTAQVVSLELIFLNKTFRGRFLVIDQAYGILGRNVLNSVRLLLEGPERKWSEHRH